MQVGKATFFQVMYLQADKLITTSLEFRTERKQLSQIPRIIVTGSYVARAKLEQIYGIWKSAVITKET